MKPLVGSYTLLNTYAICPHQAYRRYVLKDLPFVETPEMQHGIAVHTGMERRFKTGVIVYPEYERFAAPFVNLRPAVEMKVALTRDGVACDFFADQVWFRGKIDVVVTHGAHAFIADWKTGKTREYPDELEMFGLMLKARMPVLTTLQGAYIWLKEGKVGKTHDLTDFNSKFRDLVSRMDAVEQSQKMGYWPKEEGPLCRFCAVKDCEFNRNT